MGDVASLLGRIFRAIFMAFVVSTIVVTSPLMAAPFAAIVMDGRTGEVLYEKNADARLHPASLTKMMTLYIVFQEIEAGRLSLDTKVTVTKYAASQPPSRLGLKPGQKIGFDPKLFTPDQAGRFRAAAKRAGAELVAVTRNPVDEIWAGRPADPISPVLPHDMKFAGESSVEKRRTLAARLKAEGKAAAIISGPDSLCWLLNIRGAKESSMPGSLTTYERRPGARRMRSHSASGINGRVAGFRTVVARQGLGVGASSVEARACSSLAAFRSWVCSGVGRSSTGGVCGLPPPPSTGVWLKKSNSEK
mgnify:CR=1 FL=1